MLVNQSGTRSVLIVTSRKSAEPRFRRSAADEEARLAEQLLAVFEHAPSGVALVHADGRFQRVNPALCVALGRPAEALTTMRWQDVVVPADLAAVEQAVARALAGEGVEIAVRARRPDGAEVDLRIIARALQGGDRRIVAHVEDRTQRLADEVTLEAIVGRSRALLRQLIDNAPNVIAVKDRQSRYRLLNRLGAVIFGREPDEVLGLTDHDLLDAEAAAANHAEDVRTMAAGRPLTFLKDVRMPDGTVRPYLTTKFPIRGPDGGSEGVGVIAVDMSEIRQAEADRARLGALAEAAPDAIVIMAADGTITSWNPGAEEMFGLTVEAAVGRSYEDAVVPESALGTYRRIRRDLRYGRSRTVRMEALRSDGSTFPAQVSAAALADGAGTVAIIRDISDLVAAQRELERSNADLERFAYAASHDLQEPLRTIRMGAETVMLAASERLDDDERGLLAHVEQAAGRMSSQVQALMDVARLALEEVSEEQATPLQHALEDACAALSAAIREAGAQVEVDGALPVVRVPRAEMALVLQNLLSNAIKFGRPGERPVVVLRARQAGGVVELRVSDNGIGLTEAAAAKIFGLFERDRTGVPGTGVGLAVCRQILERRGGAISVSSGGPGQGAAFTLRLPDTAAVARPA
jgi:PAS domain S-box-containing protein